MTVTDEADDAVPAALVVLNDPSKASRCPWSSCRRRSSASRPGGIVNGQVGETLLGVGLAYLFGVVVPSLTRVSGRPAGA